MARPGLEERTAFSLPWHAGVGDRDSSSIRRHHLNGHNDDNNNDELHHVHYLDHDQYDQYEHQHQLGQLE